MGHIRKALEKGYLEHPRSACWTDDMSEIFVRFGRCMCCLLPLFVNRQLPCACACSSKVIRIIFVTQQLGRWTGLCKMSTTIMA